MIKDTYRGRISARDVDRTHIKELENWFESYATVRYHMHFCIKYSYICEQLKGVY